MIEKVSFTGTMLVKGSDKQIKKIDENILIDSRKKDINKKPKSHIDKNYEYESVRHDGYWGGNNTTKLFTTKEDAESLRKYYRAQKNINKDFNELKAVSELKNDNPNMWLDGCNNQIKFYKKNIEKFVKLPDKVHSAEEVLEAMKNGLFDFENLVIIKAKNFSLSRIFNFFKLR